MSIFVLKSTLAYLYLFSIISLGYARNVPRDDETRITRTTVDLLRGIFPRLKIPCLVPPQPTNGGWKLDPLFCDHGLDCDVAPGILVKTGSHLIYTCDSGYRVEGNPNIYCTTEGEWTPMPSCIRSVEADTETSSSLTPMTAASADPTQEETFESSESENNHSKMYNSETLNRSKRFSRTQVIQIVAGASFATLCAAAGSLIGPVGTFALAISCASLGIVINKGSWG